MNGAGPRRSRATTATRRGSRSPRSPGGSDGLRPASRHTCMTHPTLTKGLLKPRRDARRVWRPPAHKADPGLSRAERTPPWRGGASPTPDPVRRSSARQGALLERVREPAVGWQQPPVVRSAQLGDRGRSRPRGRRDYRNRGEAIAARAGARTAEAIVPTIEPDDRYPGIAPLRSYRRRGIEMSPNRSRDARWWDGESARPGGDRARAAVYASCLPRDRGSRRLSASVPGIPAASACRGPEHGLSSRLPRAPSRFREGYVPGVQRCRSRLRQ